MTIELSRVLNDDPSLSQTDLNYGYELRPYDDGQETVKYITSDSVNRHLRANSIRVVAREELYQIPEKFAPYAQMMVDYHIQEAGEGAYEDHNICGLYCDLTPTCEEAIIGRAKYFDLLATLYSFPCIYRNEKHNIEFSGSRYIYNEYGVVYPMSLHRGVNPIGANTIAITADRKMMVCKHADDATTNPGRLMPSGSGVASWHDYADTGVTTLQELVVHCAEYKLVLECSIPEGTELHTEVLGMARVPIGMKPDFYCVTTIDETFDELKEKGCSPYMVVDVPDGNRPSEALRDFVASRNRKEPGSVSIQLFLAAEFLAEVAM